MSELALNSKLPQEQVDISIENMKKGFASGPLDSYRRQASFDWFEMKVFVEGGEDVVEFKNNIWNTLAKDPLFDRANDCKLSFGERRRLTMKRCTKLAEYNFVTDDDVMANPFFVQAFTDAIGSFDWSLSTKYLLNRTVSEKLVKPVVTIVNMIGLGRVEIAWGVGVGGYSWEFLVGVYRSVLQILTRFQTKKCNFLHLFSDQTSYIHAHFQTWSLGRNYVMIT